VEPAASIDSKLC